MRSPKVLQKQKIFLNSEHPQNKMPRYEFGERKRIREAEGKLRAFQQMETGCSCCQVEGKPEQGELLTAAPAQLGLRASSEPGSRTSSGCQLEVWAVVCWTNPGCFLPK